MIHCPCIAASHTVLVLLDYGYSVTLVDNLSNAFLNVFDHMKRLAGDKARHMHFVQVCCMSKHSHFMSSTAAVPRHLAAQSMLYQ